MRHRVGASLAVIIFAAVLCSSPSAQAPSLDDVLKRAREAVVRYETQAALLLADEQCDQKAFESTVEASNSSYAFRGTPVRVDPKGRRKWQAELAMVRTPELARTGYPWTEFRDVVSVDGRALPDRANRLADLFLQQAEWTLRRAREIGEESARFNIGTIARDVNTPAVPLLVLHPANSARFSFEKKGEEVVERTRTWQMDYREKAAPTLISAGSGDYCPASGSFWIDPATGDVVRAVLRCAPLRAPDYVNEITVTYRRDPKLGVRVPAEMLERPESLSGKRSFGPPGRAWVEGKCTYSNYRRFETAAKLVPPK